VSSRSEARKYGLGGSVNPEDGRCVGMSALIAGTVSYLYMHLAWCDDREMGSVAGAGAVADGTAGRGAGGVVARPRLSGRLGAQARVSVVRHEPSQVI
jgi:hypothetical protein